MKIFLALFLILYSNVVSAQEKPYTLEEKKLLEEVALKIILVRFAKPPEMMTKTVTGELTIEASSASTIFRSFFDAKLFIDQRRKIYE